jgi:hypothetical protein
VKSVTHTWILMKKLEPRSRQSARQATCQRPTSSWTRLPGNIKWFGVWRGSTTMRRNLCCVLWLHSTAATPLPRISLACSGCPDSPTGNDNEAFVVRVHHETNALYHEQDFHVQDDSPESPHHVGDSQQRTRKVQAGHRSQSEADWAYAKRALARGDDPDQIIRNIADYRADDKADPTYYARLTVIKAQLSLLSPGQSRSSGPESIVLTDRDH